MSGLACVFKPQAPRHTLTRKDNGWILELSTFNAHVVQMYHQVLTNGGLLASWNSNMLCRRTIGDEHKERATWTHHHPLTVGDSRLMS